MEAILYNRVRKRVARAVLSELFSPRPDELVPSPEARQLVLAALLEMSIWQLLLRLRLANQDERATLRIRAGFSSAWHTAARQLGKDDNPPSDKELDAAIDQALDKNLAEHGEPFVYPPTSSVLRAKVIAGLTPITDDRLESRTPMGADLSRQAANGVNLVELAAYVYFYSARIELKIDWPRIYEAAEDFDRQIDAALKALGA